MTRRAAICTPIRTPVGKFLGGLSSLNAGELGAVILHELIERSGIDPTRVDDVVFAQGYGNAEAPAIGHWSWLAADLPLEVPGYQIDRRCGSGLQAVANAAMMVETGMADVVVAGGCESMSNVEHYTTDLRGGVRMGDMTLHDRLSRGRLMSQPVRALWRHHWHDRNGGKPREGIRHHTRGGGCLCRALAPERRRRVGRGQIRRATGVHRRAAKAR